MGRMRFLCMAHMLSDYALMSFVRGETTVQASESEPKAEEPPKPKPARDKQPRRKGRNESGSDDDSVVAVVVSEAKEETPKPPKAPAECPEGVSADVWKLAMKIANDSDGVFEPDACILEAQRQLSA